MNYIKTTSLPMGIEMLESLEKLKNYVKECLWNLGYGSNKHLYELRKDFFFETRAKKVCPYLLKVMRFYESSLDKWEKKYFVNEVLEKGEHYAFWHYDMSPRVYYGNEKRALSKIQEGLLNEATPF